METKIFDIKLLPDKRFLIKRGKVFDKPNEQRKACFISAMARKLRPKVKGEPEVPLSARQGRRTLHRSGFEPGLPRIWSVAGLRHRQRNSRGNHGDIGREKGGNRDVDNSVGGHQRKTKKWFSRKYYASVMNIREFLAENLGNEFVGIVAKSLDDNYRRYNH